MRDRFRDAMSHAPAQRPVETCKSSDAAHVRIEIPVPREELKLVSILRWICVEYTTAAESQGSGHKPNAGTLGREFTTKTLKYDSTIVDVAASNLRDQITMLASVRNLVTVLALLSLIACTRTAPPVAHAASGVVPKQAPRIQREVRITGAVEAVHSSKILVPQIFGQGGPMTLTRLIPNGSRVKQGDLIALFDSTA